VIANIAIAPRAGRLVLFPGCHERVTEIVMGLRWTRAQMLETEPELPDDLREQATCVHAGLDKLLR
jgi:hypothetical protein